MNINNDLLRSSLITGIITFPGIVTGLALRSVTNCRIVSIVGLSCMVNAVCVFIFNIMILKFKNKNTLNNKKIVIDESHKNKINNKTTTLTHNKINNKEGPQNPSHPKTEQELSNPGIFNIFGTNNTIKFQETNQLHEEKEKQSLIHKPLPILEKENILVVHKDTITLQPNEVKKEEPVQPIRLNVTPSQKTAPTLTQSQQMAPAQFRGILGLPLDLPIVNKILKHLEPRDYGRLALTNKTHYKNLIDQNKYKSLPSLKNLTSFRNWFSRERREYLLKKEAEMVIPWLPFHCASCSEGMIGGYYVVMQIRTLKNGDKKITSLTGHDDPCGPHIFDQKLYHPDAQNSIWEVKMSDWVPSDQGPFNGNSEFSPIFNKMAIEAHNKYQNLSQIEKDKVDQVLSEFHHLQPWIKQLIYDLNPKILQEWISYKR